MKKTIVIALKYIYVFFIFIFNALSSFYLMEFGHMHLDFYYQSRIVFPLLCFVIIHTSYSLLAALLLFGKPKTRDLKASKGLFVFIVSYVFITVSLLALFDNLTGATADV